MTQLGARHGVPQTEILPSLGVLMYRNECRSSHLDLIYHMYMTSGPLIICRLAVCNGVNCVFHPLKSGKTICNLATKIAWSRLFRRIQWVWNTFTVIDEHSTLAHA